MSPITIDKEEAIQRFRLNSGKYDVLPRLGYDSVVLIEGNTIINADLNIDTALELIFGNKIIPKQSLIIVNGDLTIKGDLNLKSRMHKMYLLVLGNLYCDVLMSTNTIMHFTGDAHIKHVFNANYNDGITTIEGTTYVPYFLHSNHCANVNFDKATTLINYYGDDDGGWGYNFDYFESDLVKVLKENICPGNSFNRDHFIAHVKSGLPPFK